MNSTTLKKGAKHLIRHGTLGTFSVVDDCVTSDCINSGVMPTPMDSLTPLYPVGKGLTMDVHYAGLRNRCIMQCIEPMRRWRAARYREWCLLHWFVNEYYLERMQQKIFLCIIALKTNINTRHRCHAAAMCWCSFSIILFCKHAIPQLVQICCKCECILPTREYWIMQALYIHDFQCPNVHNILSSIRIDNRAIAIEIVNYFNLYISRNNELKTNITTWHLWHAIFHVSIFSCVKSVLLEPQLKTNITLWFRLILNISKKKDRPFFPNVVW